MEQLIDTFDIDWRIILVQIVNFGFLLVLLWYVLYKPFLSLIENRKAQIIKGVADAERAEVALKDAQAKKIDIITKASIEAESILSSARNIANTKETEPIKDA
jgi:F0F1-type ATP synthase membrane subunit b/b'